MITHHHGRLGLWAAMALVAFLPWHSSLSLAETGGNSTTPSALSAATGTAAKEMVPETVEIGFWPTVIYGLDVHSNTYCMTAYVWFIWNGPIDPVETVEFKNNVDSWGLTKDKCQDAPVTLPDGRHYQCLRIEGKFFQPFTLTRFPLENHTLALTIEDNTYPAGNIIYKFDRRDSGVDGGVKIPGWSIGEWNGEESVHHYPTDFGKSARAERAADYSSVTYKVEVKRPLNYFLLKMLLPLMIVLIANWSALFLHPKELQTRMALTGTALLTAVFLQQAYSSSLPEVNYLVLMDKVYVVAYILIIASLIQEVIQGSIMRRGRVEQGVRALWIDTTSVLIQILIFAASLALIITRTK